MSKKLKKRMYRILLGAALLIATLVIEKLGAVLNQNITLLLYLISYFIVGGDVVKEAVSNIGRGRIFDEQFLMALATIGAFLVSDYEEAVAVMLFYQVGELFQSYAVQKSRKSITELMNIRPDFANVKRNQKIETVDPEEVQIGEIIVIKPGERVALDGRIISGNTTLDTMALTGESVPREQLVGDEIISGCINLSGVIEVEVTKTFGESTVSKILDLVENASSKKAEAENFITKFARYYTPIVVVAALLLAIIPPIILGGNWNDWIYRALTFLVISCPCALVISIPLSFFGGIGGASKAGVLIKGSNYLEALANVEVMVFDKTGTLTKGVFEVADIAPSEGMDEEKLLEITALAECFSNHPISLSLCKAYGKEIDKNRVSEVNDIPGFGLSAMVDGNQVYVGNEKLMNKFGILFKATKEIGTIIYVAINHKYAGHILISDQVKEDSKDAIQALIGAGIKRIVMLTGDRKEVGEAVAKNLGISETHTELLPADKVEQVEKLLSEKSDSKILAFVGDGINDAPVLARADVGIAMGGLGSDAAIEAADIVIMTDEPLKIATAIKISRKTLRIVKQNIVFAIGVKILVLLMAALGIASMWLAIFADVGVAILAILNAIRALKVPK
ncbi:MAG: heavy metal translocating P-type ATPase [Lachnospiraceae bacterium]|nr:heavy metal translocating P-type ATPase [Lachnospiraceae bacterium]